MKINPENTSLYDFFNIMSGINTFKKHTLLVNYNQEVVGTLDELNKLAKETESIELKRLVFELNENVNKYISSVEIIHYLKEITINFDVGLTKTTLFELEVFENMVFDEEINEALTTEYIKEGWIKPTYKFFHPILDKEVIITDYKKMKKKVFPFITMDLDFTKQYLEKKIKSKQDKEPQQEKEILKEQLFEMQNNLIPKVSIENVYNHFKILTELTNKKDVFYLTNSQLITFIKSTFIDKKPIKQDFNGKPRTKKEVREIFYYFYFNNKNKETNQTSIKHKYFNIMNDSFYGFNKNDYTDFAK